MVSLSASAVDRDFLRRDDLEVVLVPSASASTCNPEPMGFSIPSPKRLNIILVEIRNFLFVLSCCSPGHLPRSHFCPRPLWLSPVGKTNRHHFNKQNCIHFKVELRRESHVLQCLTARAVSVSRAVIILIPFRRIRRENLAMKQYCPLIEGRWDGLRRERPLHYDPYSSSQVH